jgi:hypothetical protein
MFTRVVELTAKFRKAGELAETTSRIARALHGSRSVIGNTHRWLVARSCSSASVANTPNPLKDSPVSWQVRFSHFPFSHFPVDLVLLREHNSPRLEEPLCVRDLPSLFQTDPSPSKASSTTRLADEGFAQLILAPEHIGRSDNPLAYCKVAQLEFLLHETLPGTVGILKGGTDENYHYSNRGSRNASCPVLHTCNSRIGTSDDHNYRQQISDRAINANGDITATVDINSNVCK